MIYVLINSRVFLLREKLELGSLLSLNRLVFLNSAGGLCLILSILSLGGLPPFFGFLIKFLALECLIRKGSFLVSGFLVSGRLLSLFFYLRIAFKRSLTFFPQHSLRVFSWRIRMLEKRNFTFSGLVLSFLVSLSLFGLVCFPVLVSFI